MGDDKNLCESHFLLHDAAIKKNSADIEVINKNYSGIPEKLENIVFQIDKLCIAIEKIDKKIDEKYVTKEVCDIETREVKNSLSNLYKGMGSIALLLMAYFVAHITGKI